MEAAAHGELILVPRIDGRYARVGTIAKIEEEGRVRGGADAVVIRGLHRGVVGVGVPGTGSATWVQIEPIHDGQPSRAGDRARPRVPRDPGEHRGVARHPAGRGVPARHLGPGTDRGHGRLLPGPQLRAQGRGPRDDRRRGAAGEGPRLGQGHARRDRREGAHPRRGVGEPREATARVDPARADGRDPQGARRGGRRRRHRRAPHEDRRGGHAGRGPRAGGARARPARAHLGAVPRARLDPDLPRLADRRAVVGADRRRPGHRRGARASSTPITKASTT